MDFALKQSSPPLKFPTSNGLVLAAAVLAFGATFSVLCVQESREQEKQLAALDRQARFAVLTVDTKIEIELQQLRELAESDSFQRRQFNDFYHVARQFAQGTRRQIVLHDVQRNAQIFNTDHPLNANLHEGAKFLQQAELDRVRANEPYISGLFYARLAQKNLIAVAVPVTEAGSVRYLLGVAVDPHEILAAVKDATLAKGTVTSIVDHNGTLLARSEENDRYAGRKAPINVAERQEPSGRYKATTFAGAPVNLSYLKSNLTGWVAISYEYDRGDRQWPFVAGLIAALVVVIFGFLLIVLASAREHKAPASDFSGSGRPGPREK